MDERYYNPYAVYNPQSMEGYENQMGMENGAVSQYNNRYGHFLNNILAQMFSDGVAYANPTPAPAPQVRESHPKGFGRPMVMTYDEYKRQYMPYQYAERMQNQMLDNYDNYIQGINLDEYLDRLE